MRNIAIYDLDRTVSRRSTFTPFLFFAALRNEPLRLCLAPAWITAMAMYKLGFFSRRALKQFGLRLFLGHRWTRARLEMVSDAFADRVVPNWLSPRALQAIASDRRDGYVLILATAAMEFYAVRIAEQLGFQHVIASRNKPLSAERSACLIDGNNCYGAEKPVRLEALLAQLGWRRSDCFIKFYTDSPSDAPLLDWVDQPILVNAGAVAARRAASRGWTQISFR